MASLTKHSRSPHSPSPIYGIRPGFTVGDLEASRATQLHVYGTFTTPTGSEPENVWDAVKGKWVVMDVVSSQRTTSDAGGTVVSPGARVVKIQINVTGTGTVDVSAKSNSDSYSATIFDPGALSAGFYEFMLGGWASPSSDATSYGATQYGAVKSGSSPAATNPTGDQETVHPDPAADSNYVGGTYNPFQFLSLDGYALKFFATVVGSVGFDVSVTPVS